GEEYPPGQKEQQASQDQHGAPHRGAQDRVIDRVGNKVFDGRQTQGFVFSIKRTWAEVQTADFHAGPDSGCRTGAGIAAGDGKRIYLERLRLFWKIYMLFSLRERVPGASGRQRYA